MTGFDHIVAINTMTDDANYEVIRVSLTGGQNRVIVRTDQQTEADRIAAALDALP